MATKQDSKQKQEAKGFLHKVPDDHMFYCKDGWVLKDMKDLARALASMDDETFIYHSNTGKNDFSNWLTNVIGDKKLAKDLKNILDRNQAAGIVANRIAVLSKMSN